MQACRLTSYLLTSLPLLLAACASVSAPVPEWAVSAAAIRAVYPDADYIAQRGGGKTREAAETNAASELARFISSQITADRGYEITVQNGAESVNTKDQAWVQTRINLAGIRYADPYYRRDLKEWQTVAYLEREEAWAVYEPGFRRQAEAFAALCAAAEAEADPFKRALRFAAAAEFSRTDDFTGASLFGQTLHPRRMNAEFGPARALLAGLPQKTDEARRGASVYIDCPVDFESLLNNAFAARFTALGFPVVKTRREAAAVCTVTVDEGMVRRDLGIFYSPSLRAALAGSSGALLAWSASGDQASAVTPDVAKRRAYKSLADKVLAGFTVETN